MNSLVCLVVSYAVNSLWIVPLVGGAGWAASRLLKRVGPGAQHAAWVATLALAVVTPALPLWRALPGLLPASGATHAQAFIALTPAPDMGMRTGVVFLPALVVLGLSVLYLGTVFYFAARFGWSLYWTRSILRDACPVLLNAEDEEL